MEAKSPRVLHVITGLLTGGAEMVLARLATSPAPQDSPPVIVSLMAGGPVGERLERAGIRVESLGMRRGMPSAEGIGRIRRIVREVQPTVIQGWMYHGNLAASYAAVLAERRPAVAWNVRQTLTTLRRERLMTRAAIRLNRLLSGRVDAVVYNSSVARAQHEEFGFSAARAVVIANGFDCQVYRPDPAAGPRLRAELGVEAGSPLVGLVNRYHPMKGHAVFFGAARLLLDQGLQASFVCAGPGVSWNNLALRQLVERHGLAGQVHLLGERTDTPAIFAGLDVACCASSWGEAFPNVVGEAMACGTPCVATDIGETAEVLGGTGVVVPAGDVRALAEGIARVLCLPECERRAMGDRGRERIASRYSLDAMVRSYHELYVALAQRRACAGN